MFGVEYLMNITRISVDYEGVSIKRLKDISKTEEWRHRITRLSSISKGLEQLINRISDIKRFNTQREN